MFFCQWFLPSYCWWLLDAVLGPKDCFHFSLWSGISTKYTRASAPVDSFSSYKSRTAAIMWEVRLSLWDQIEHACTVVSLIIVWPFACSRHQQSFKLPGVLCFVDGTEVTIACPPENRNPQSFWTRKHQYALNTMVVSSPNFIEQEVPVHLIFDCRSSINPTIICFRCVIQTSS